MFLLRSILWAVRQPVGKADPHQEDADAISPLLEHTALNTTHRYYGIQSISLRAPVSYREENLSSNQRDVSPYSAFRLWSGCGLDTS